MGIENLEKVLLLSTLLLIYTDISYSLIKMPQCQILFNCISPGHYRFVNYLEGTI